MTGLIEDDDRLPEVNYERDHEWQRVGDHRATSAVRWHEQCRRCGLKVCVLVLYPSLMVVRSEEAQETPCRA